MITRRIIGAFAVAATVSLAGCGGVAEKAIEKASGCKDVDLSNKGATAKCGNESFQFGENVSLPAGFPSALKPPKGAKLTSAVKSTSNGSVNFNLMMMLPGSAKSASATLKALLDNAGFTISDDGLTEGSDGVGGTLSAHDDTWNVMYSFGSNPNPLDKTKGTYIIEVVHEMTDDEKADATSTTLSDSSDSSDSSSSSGSGTSSSDGSNSISSPQGASLPDGFPSDLPMPSGATVTSAMRNVTNGSVNYIVSISTHETVTDLYNELKSTVTGAGLTLSTDNLTDMGNGAFAVIAATGSSYDLTLNVSSDASDGTNAIASITVNEK